LAFLFRGAPPCKAHSHQPTANSHQPIISSSRYEGIGLAGRAFGGVHRSLADLHEPLHEIAGRVIDSRTSIFSSSNAINHWLLAGEKPSQERPEDEPVATHH